MNKHQYKKHLFDLKQYLSTQFDITKLMSANTLRGQLNMQKKYVKIGKISMGKKPINTEV